MDEHIHQDDNTTAELAEYKTQYGILSEKYNDLLELLSKEKYEKEYLQAKLDICTDWVKLTKEYVAENREELKLTAEDVAEITEQQYFMMAKHISEGKNWEVREERDQWDMYYAMNRAVKNYLFGV